MEDKQDFILLHVCCGPCASGVVPALMDDEQSFECFFYNSNIQPESEYHRRLNTFNDYAEQAGLIVHEGTYEPSDWHEAIGDAAGVFPLIRGDANYDKNRSARTTRCRRCYEQRFEQLAKYAAEQGFGAISTTLSISPYQFRDFIDLCLGEAAHKQQLRSAFVDYSSRYHESLKTSQELGMYRQNYCGCIYSQEEAELERAARAAAKAEAKAAAKR